MTDLDQTRPTKNSFKIVKLIWNNRNTTQK